MNNKHIYRIIFHNQGSIYELYARNVYEGEMYAFVEIANLIFGERSELVVDPTEEQLKSEFSGVKRTYIPIQSVIRIDEVEKEGQNKITPTDNSKGNITPFPMPASPPSKTSR